MLVQEIEKSKRRTKGNQRGIYTTELRSESWLHGLFGQCRIVQPLTRHAADGIGLMHYAVYLLDPIRERLKVALATIQLSEEWNQDEAPERERRRDRGKVYFDDGFLI